jgi:phosphate/sulfate permease
MAVPAAGVIALGTLSGGWRIVRTMGPRITRLRPVSGFSAEAGAAIALFGSTAIGAPVSTTHTVAGAVSGVVGVTNRGTTTRRRPQWTLDASGTAPRQAATRA